MKAGRTALSDAKRFSCRSSSARFLSIRCCRFCSSDCRLASIECSWSVRSVTCEIARDRGAGLVNGQLFFCEHRVQLWSVRSVTWPFIWCEIARQWSTLHPEFSFLPRKFKIAITGAADDRAAIDRTTRINGDTRRRRRHLTNRARRHRRHVGREQLNNGGGGGG